MGAVNNNIVSLPESLLAEVTSAALAEERSVDEVVAEALRRYLDAQSWLKFVDRNERRAKELGMTEDDVDRLIAEYRAENQSHGN